MIFEHDLDLVPKLTNQLQNATEPAFALVKVF